MQKETRKLLFWQHTKMAAVVKIHIQFSGSIEMSVNAPGGRFILDWRAAMFDLLFRSNITSAVPPAVSYT